MRQMSKLHFLLNKKHCNIRILQVTEGQSAVYILLQKLVAFHSPLCYKHIYIGKNK